MLKLKLTVLRWVLGWFMPVKSVTNSTLISGLEILRGHIEHDSAPDYMFKVPTGIDVIPAEKSEAGLVENWYTIFGADRNLSKSVIFNALRVYNDKSLIQAALMKSRDYATFIEACRELDALKKLN